MPNSLSQKEVGKSRKKKSPNPLVEMCWWWEGTKVHALGCVCSSGMNISCFVKLFMAACGSLFLPSLSLSLSISLSLSLRSRFSWNESYSSLMRAWGKNVHSNILALRYQHIKHNGSQNESVLQDCDKQITFVDCIKVCSIKLRKLADSWVYLQIHRKTWRCTMTWKSLCVWVCMNQRKHRVMRSIFKS